MHPTHRISRSRRGNRRSHHALKKVNAALCPNCGSPRLPHAACTTCGYVRPGLQLKQPEQE